MNFGRDLDLKEQARGSSRWAGAKVLAIDTLTKRMLRRGRSSVADAQRTVGEGQSFLKAAIVINRSRAAMTDAGFIGETPRQSLPEPNDAARLVRDYATMLAGLGGLGAAVGGLYLGFVVTPFHYYDAIAVVGVALGPAVLVLLGTRLLAPGLGGPIKRLDALCGLFLFCIAAPGNYILLLNERLDRSAAVEQDLPVKATWIRSGRHGNDAFMASVLPSMASPLGRWSFYSDQPVRIGEAEWHRLVPGESRLSLRVHPGRFGFAWYEPDPSAAPR